MKKLVATAPNRRGLLAVSVLACHLCVGAARAEIITFAYTSDPHYGITRTFNGATGVGAQTVNQAMLSRMSALQGTNLPADNKVGAGQALSFTFMAVTGDFANRNETGIPVASTSWGQFKADYLDSKPLGNIPVYLTPGNHDVSNAIGLKGKVGTIDNAALVGVFNYNNSTTSADSSF
ncbi:MAG: metallophosphoesterase, partial [Armatimonadota bacterium]